MHVCPILAPLTFRILAPGTRANCPADGPPRVPSPGARPPLEAPEVRPGELALVGGSEWAPGCEEIDRHLLELSGTSEVLVLPTAAAYWHPERAVAKQRLLTFLP